MTFIVHALGLLMLKILFWIHCFEKAYFGEVLLSCLIYLATTKSTTTSPQTMTSCVGETVFLPSFFPVSALGNNVVTWKKGEGLSVVTAKNGVTTSNYSYNLINVSTSDAGVYRADVKAPNKNLKFGPQVRLTIKEKPGKYI